MKILLIAPASGRWRQVARRRFFGGRTFRFSMLSLLSVAAENPEQDDVILVDEQVEPVPWNADVDLVGITCMTALAPRAYEIASRFRARGVPVVLGGMHPTLSSQEALKYADAIVVGEAEGVWARVVEDARRGRLAGAYERSRPIGLDALQPLPRDLLDSRRYAGLTAIQATRGCPHQCEFCSVSAFSQARQRRRPIGDVVREVAAAKDRFLLIVDDNLMCDRSYARELFDGLAPLGKSWITQSTLAMAQDEDFVAHAARAGCRGVFIGLEAFSQEELRSAGKGFNRVEEYREAIDRLHRHGIGVEAGIVFGFDGQGPGVFARTLSLLDELEVDVAQISILTPLPGTPLAKRMRDRVTDRDWSHYDFHHAVFRPIGMTAEQLKAGHDWVTRSFYEPWQIARRVLRHFRRPGGWKTARYVAAVNLAYYGRVTTWGIWGHDPAAKADRPVTFQAAA